MKELLQPLRLADRTLGESISNTDSKFLDHLAMKMIEFSLQFGPGHALKTNKGRFWWHTWIERVANGQKTPSSFYGRRVLDGFRINSNSQELSTEGPRILVVNHPSGPIQGLWSLLGLKLTIVERFNDEEAEPYWIVKDWSNHPILGRTSLANLRERATHLMGANNRTLFFGRDEMSRETMVREAKGYLRQGQFLVLTTEGQESAQLTRVKPGVGNLLAEIVEGEKTPILPVGLWRKDDDLNIRFGEVIDLNDISSKKADSPREFGQKIADRVALEIARLLPEERRGVYRHLVDSQT